MPPIPNHMLKFIQANHVVSFATHTQDNFWAASCFYAFDEKKVRLIILTSKKTMHAQLMLENPYIVGTICGQTEKIKDIEGIQFSAIAKCLEAQDIPQALQIYYQKHPLARLKSSNVWELSFQVIKYTSNKIAFAQKMVWNK